MWSQARWAAWWHPSQGEVCKWHLGAEGRVTEGPDKCMGAGGGGQVGGPSQVAQVPQPGSCLHQLQWWFSPHPSWGRCNIVRDPRIVPDMTSEAADNPFKWDRPLGTVLAQWEVPHMTAPACRGPVLGPGHRDLLPCPRRPREETLVLCTESRAALCPVGCLGTQRAGGRCDH